MFSLTRCGEATERRPPTPDRIRKGAQILWPISCRIGFVVSADTAEVYALLQVVSHCKSPSFPRVPGPRHWVLARLETVEFITSATIHRGIR